MGSCLDTFSRGRGWYNNTHGASLGLEICIFFNYLSHSEGSRTRAQRLGEMEGEKG